MLTGVHPLRLSEWFWAGFADAMEWVELPNVVGMGTFGDGGLLASKPYVSVGGLHQPDEQLLRRLPLRPDAAHRSRRLPLQLSLLDLPR